MYKIQLKLVSFDNNFLNKYLKLLPVHFPYLTIKTNSNILTVLKSPHVHKKSRIQYKFISYNKIISLNKTTFLELLKLLKELQKYKKEKINLKLKIKKTS